MHSWHCLNLCKSKNHPYYRYRWGRGRQQWGSVQLPGERGEELTEARATEVKRWINLGLPPGEITSLIKKWRAEVD